METFGVFGFCCSFYFRGYCHFCPSFIQDGLTLSSGTFHNQVVGWVAVGVLLTWSTRTTVGVLRRPERTTMCLAAGRQQFVESACTLHDDKHVKFFSYLQVGLDMQLERADSHLSLRKAVSIFKYFSKSDKVSFL